MSEKVLIIGWDGADWRILQPYLEDGLLPNLARLIESGVSGNLRSTLPTNSGVAWPTFMTGRNSGKHGVYDFTQRWPQDPTRMVGNNSRSMRSETFFGALGRHGRQVGAVNVPVSYPPFPINGFMLGGMFVQEGKPYTLPESLETELNEKVGGFLPNRIRWRYMLGQYEALLDEAIAVTRQRARILEYLIDHKAWDVLTYVFVSPDRLQHPLMHLFDPEHPCHDKAEARRLQPKMRQVFKILDDILGRSMDQIGNDANLLLISDHGFRSVHKAVYVREMLIREGLLRVNRKRGTTPAQLTRKLLRPILPAAARQAISKNLPTNGRSVGSAHEMANVVWPESQAFVTTTTSQGVYINLVGREPHGTVEPGSQYERLLSQIEEILLAERDPVTNQPVIESVVRAAEVYHGPYLNLAPDLLFVPAPGYTSAKGAKAHLQPFEWFMGDHDPDGIVVGSGPGFKKGQKIKNAGLIDIAPTALYLAGVPIPEDMDGQVLDLFGDQRLSLSPPSYEQGPALTQDSSYSFTPEEERQVEEQLRSLGYM